MRRAHARHEQVCGFVFAEGSTPMNFMVIFLTIFQGLSVLP